MFRLQRQVLLKDIKSKIADDPKKFNKKVGPTPTDDELLRMNDNYVPFTFR